MNNATRMLARLAVVFALCLGCSAALAASETFVPPDPGSDLDDLDHGKYYIWGIDVTWDTTTDMVETAALFFSQLHNHDNGTNDLWVHLLDDGPLGITTGNDWQDGVDEFLGQGILLVHYEDLSSSPEDRTYVFNDDQIETLNTYALDGRIALAFDPDCHFYNEGIEFTVGTDTIPEPATFLIAGVGVLLAVMRKRKSA